MRILVNDHAGHPFQIELSRELANRGHVVRHTYTENLVTPRGDFTQLGANPRLSVVPIQISESFERYSYRKRVEHEIRLGLKLGQAVREFECEALLSANTPLLSQWIMQRSAKRAGVRFIFWLQDMLGTGIRQQLDKRNTLLGRTIGAAAQRLEHHLLKSSDAVICITEDFVPELVDHGTPSGIISTIHNWAPLKSFASGTSTGWAEAHNLSGKFVALYSGTLGLKHDPELLLALARQFEHLDNARLVVVSEGPGAKYFEDCAREERLRHSRVLPFQPFEKVPEVLASADVLLALLGSQAGKFSVPSKVLTYLCTGKPIVAAMPVSNLASRILLESGAGIVVEPGNAHMFTDAVHSVLADDTIRCQMGHNAQAYAEDHFNIDSIATRFEEVIGG